MWQKRTRFFRWKTLAVAALLASVAAGCEGGKPTEPEPISLPDLFGSQLLKADGSPVGVNTLGNTTLIGIYVASPGCPACGGFTPILIDSYNQLQDAGRSFEVVLVSPGISELAMLD